MIIALFALAAVMIVGGIASVVQGFPYVRLESGWTMTIAGAATASSGALLLGLAVVATHLRRLERILTGQGRAEDEEDSVLVETPGRIEPTGLATGIGEVATLSAGRQRPSFVGMSEPRAVTPARGAEEPRMEMLPPGGDPSAPLLPDLLPEPPAPIDEGRQDPVRPADPEEAAPRRVKPNKPPRTAKPTPLVDTVIPAPEPAAEAVSPVPVTPSPRPAQEAGADEPLGLRPSLADEPVPAPAGPGEAASAAEPAKAGLHVVGTYASGGNTYVMYSNGSIEADTPRGQFTFDSLDELKAFVEAGGEDGTRGAA